VPQDPNDEPAIELLKRINPKFTPCDNGHSGKMPEGWIYCNLKDVANIQDNKRCPIKTEERNKRSKGKSILYPYYGATGIAGYIDDFLLDGKYILLGEDGAPFLDKYAKKAYEAKGKIWVNNHVHILEPQINFSYLLHYLNTVDYSYYVKGTTRLKLTQSDMSSIKVLLPPLSEQQRIATKIEEIFAILDEIQKSIED
jgi:type I restriction enzyme S subunit